MEHRAAAARSCATMVGQKWRVRRSVVLELVRQACGVDLSETGSDADLELAMAVLVNLKAHGMPARQSDA